MKRIVYLSDYPLDTIGGSQKSTITTIKQMYNLGYDVSVIMPKAKSNLDELRQTCKIYEYEKKGKKNKFLYYKYKLNFIKNSIKESNCDIIHAENIQSSIFVGILKKFNKVDKNIRFVYTDRGFFETYIRKHQLLFKFISNMFDVLITTTQANKKSWSKTVNPNKITCVANILDEDWYEYSKKEEQKVKNKYNIKDKIVIGFSGRYIDYKRWDTVKEICNNMKQKSNILFMFAMTADTEELRKQMNEYIQDIKSILKDQLILLIDANIQEMKEFYYATDIFVLTSDRESFGRTLIEAMTKNNIVFGTNSGGVPDVIKDMNFLFEVGDVKDIVNKINKYIDKEKDINKDKEYFRNFVEKEYSVKKFSEDMDNIYKNIIIQKEGNNE